MRGARFWVGLFLTLVVTAVAAACGTGEADDGSNAEKREIVEADAAWAEAHVLRRADLQGRWRAEPDEEPPEPEECDAIDYSDLTITGEATASFAAPDGAMFFAHELAVYETEEQALSALRRGSADEVTACVREVLEDELARGSTGVALDDVEARETEGLQVGDSRRSFRIEATLREVSETVPAAAQSAQQIVRVVFFTTVFVRDRALSAVAYGSFGTEFPSGIATMATEAIDGRLRANPPPG